MNKKGRIYVNIYENNGRTIIVRSTIMNGDQKNYHDTQKCFSRKRKFDSKEENEEVEEEEKHRDAFHPYSPEANSVIRAVNGVSSKPSLDRDLYKRHVDSHVSVLFEVPEQLLQIVSAVTETTG
ncbi:hypothetical protein G6F56_007804 [Rhizopus delemar]|nr:hypothetical protein G6F56_007804 [Rhizopus delemar]